MAHPNLKIRAAIFDIYGTILEVGAPPANAETLWQKLFNSLLDAPAPLSRTEFSRRSSQIIARRHAEAKARGVRWPEIVWPAVVMEVIPSLARLSARKRDEFILRQMQIGRSLRLAPGAADCLRRLNEERIELGIASNSQAYTLREVDDALRGAGLNLSMFDPELRFWSFENGFSKPDPHVFRILTTRLEARGFSPGETLMVGDRLDNDVEPARAYGWQTWQLTARPTREPAGNWRELRAWLAANRA
jgi:FMN phosphatase YigB (HAD superfamily)